MIEIIVAVWITCFCLSMITVAFNYYFTRKKLFSNALKNLNVNLEKVGLYWSNSSADFLPLSLNSVQTDASKTLKNTFLLGALGLASVPGFLLLVITVLSIHLLARSRKERATFNSALVQNSDLSRSEVENLINEFNQIF